MDSSTEPEKLQLLTPHQPADAPPRTATPKRRRPFLPFLAIFALALLVLSSIHTPSSCWSRLTGANTSNDDATPAKFSHNIANIDTIHAQANGEEISSSSHSIQSRSPETETGTGTATTTTTISAPTPSRTVLKCFEVDQPVLLPDGAAESDGSGNDGKYEAESCTVLLMRRDFAWSYEDPFIGKLLYLLLWGVFGGSCV